MLRLYFSTLAFYVNNTWHQNGITNFLVPQKPCSLPEHDSHDNFMIDHKLSWQVTKPLLNKRNVLANIFAITKDLEIRLFVYQVKTIFVFWQSHIVVIDEETHILQGTGTGWCEFLVSNYFVLDWLTVSHYIYFIVYSPHLNCVNLHVQRLCTCHEVT